MLAVERGTNECKKNYGCRNYEFRAFRRWSGNWQIMFNKQPSFTGKIPRLQLVKIDHVFSVYLSLTDETMRLWTLTLYLDLTMAESSINSNHWIYESKWFLSSFYSSKSCHLLEYTLKSLNLAGVLIHVQQFFLRFGQVWSLGFLWSSFQHFWSVFLFDFLKWNSTYNYWNWFLFVVWWQTRTKNMKIQEYFKMAIFGQN